MKEREYDQEAYEDALQHLGETVSEFVDNSEIGQEELRDALRTLTEQARAGAYHAGE